MTRAQAFEKATSDSTPWDVVVIGGGASGFGAAVDAAARGFRTLLLEASDFGKGTSSRSTKLVHGGVRYLRQGQIGLVRESLRERGLLLRNAPHLTRRLAFVVPAYSWADVVFYGTGLKLYDILAGKLSLGATRVLGRDDVLRELPTLKAEGLRGGVCYLDGQFDDSRLIVALAQTLFDLGGVALNYAPVLNFRKSGGRVAGVSIRDAEGNQEYTIRARAVINATGAFVDELRRLDDPSCVKLLTVSQGAHIVLDRSFLPGETALMIPKTPDKRVLFAIPWQGHTLVGTTDIPVSGPQAEPKPMAQEISFILETAGRYLAREPHASDILSTFAGLRPLVRPGKDVRTANVSRDYTLHVSSTGLITLTGGKWTTYRRMGEAAIDMAIMAAGLPVRPGATRELRLHGWDTAKGAAEGLELLHPAFSVTREQVRVAAREEMARTVEDVLARRTRMLFLNARAAIEAAPLAASLLGSELERDELWQARQVQEFTALAQNYLP